MHVGVTLLETEKLPQPIQTGWRISTTDSWETCRSLPSLPPLLADGTGFSAPQTRGAFSHCPERAKALYFPLTNSLKFWSFLCKSHFTEAQISSVPVLTTGTPASLQGPRTGCILHCTLCSQEWFKAMEKGFSHFLADSINSPFNAVLCVFHPGRAGYTNN